MFYSQVVKREAGFYLCENLTFWIIYNTALAISTNKSWLLSKWESFSWVSNLVLLSYFPLYSRVAIWNFGMVDTSILVKCIYWGTRLSRKWAHMPTFMNIKTLLLKKETNRPTTCVCVCAIPKRRLCFCEFFNTIICKTHNLPKHCPACSKLQKLFIDRDSELQEYLWHVTSLSSPVVPGFIP